MRAHLVLQKPLLGDKLILTHVTLERLLPRVVHLVQLQILFRLQFFGAKPALELGVLVGQLVFLAPGDVAEASAAVLALVVLRVNSIANFRCSSGLKICLNFGFKFLTLRRMLRIYSFHRKTNQI